ncbi:MAG TPA: hypothetical protein VN033_09420 [Vulgatibacter sp.]|nr:hypothetical protein [Vulgatibacter sp.]
MRLALAAAFAVAIAFSLPACGALDGMNCTEMACSDAVSVDFEPAFSEPGAYEVAAAWEGGTLTCAVTLPAGSPRADECESSISGPFPGEVVLGGEGHEILRGVWVRSAPPSIEITVRHEGVVVASSRLEPSYRKHHPNGEECDGDYFCRVSQTKLVRE